MHADEPELTHDAEARVADALRRLPDPGVPADGWARVAAALAAPPRAPVRASVAAVAGAACAALLVAGLWLRNASGPAVPGSSVVAVGEPDSGAPPAPADDDWRARSFALERLLAELPEPRTTRASTGLTTALLEDRIALVDERLSDAAGGGLEPGTVAALHRERALLLYSLVRVRFAAAADPST